MDKALLDPSTLDLIKFRHLWRVEREKRSTYWISPNQYLSKCGSLIPPRERGFHLGFISEARRGLSINKPEVSLLTV
jgi:hypothetical protein